YNYTFNVPPGNYQVTMKFAELYWTAAGDRVFNVSVNGVAVLTNFDIFSEVGQDHADDRVFNNIAPSGGQIVIQLGPASHDHPTVDAIQIIPEPATATPSPSATLSPSRTASPAPTRTGTPTNTSLPTATLSWTPSPAPTKTGTPTNTALPTATASWTASPLATATATPTNSPVPTATLSWTASPLATKTGTPTNTALPTATSSWTASPAATMTASPTLTATGTEAPSVTATATATPGASLTPTPDATPDATAGGAQGPPQIDQAYGVPNPNPSSIVFHLKGYVDDVNVQFYTKAMAQFWSGNSGPENAGWGRINVPAAVLANIPNGVFYAALTPYRNGGAGKRMMIILMALH
ncbi:MAG TPA: malectin domain-containing carbohydrate-binding protein, partial [bacterium]|nr:malectin domain-containing carbohydrate-binding protein [bacterium]